MFSEKHVSWLTENGFDTSAYHNAKLFFEESEENYAASTIPKGTRRPKSNTARRGRPPLH